MNKVYWVGPHRGETLAGLMDLIFRCPGRQKALDHLWQLAVKHQSVSYPTNLAIRDNGDFTRNTLARIEKAE